MRHIPYTIDAYVYPNAKKNTQQHIATSKQGNSEEIYREIIFDLQQWQYDDNGSCSISCVPNCATEIIYTTQQFAEIIVYIHNNLRIGQNIMDDGKRRYSH
jgi:hypothetical protein